MKRRAEHPNRERIAKELRKGMPLTKFDLELRCHLSLRNVNAYLKIMHEAGEIHIHSYRRDTPHGSPTTVWIWGAGKDARKPRPMTGAQKSRRYRARNPEAALRETLRKRRIRETDKLTQGVNLYEHRNGIPAHLGGGQPWANLLRVRSAAGEDQ